MFQIALCEDEKIFAETQEKLCREILGRMHIEYDISVFDNGDDLLAAFAGGAKHYDLIFLDIVMDGPDGIEVARKIRETGAETDIVFVTGSREYAIESYDVGALHYLTKPVEAERLESLIKRVYEDKFQSNYFPLKSGAQTLRIAVKDIIALETVGRKVEITTADGPFYYSGKLTELLTKLPAGHFVRCHQAYAVNINNIRELDRSKAIAVNGKKIAVSRPYLKDLQTAFLLSMQER